MSITTGNSALTAIDTGTTAIGGPTNDVAAIWAAVPGATAARGQGSQGFFEFRASPTFSALNIFVHLAAACSTTVNVSLSFGGQAWAINPIDMNLGPVEDGSSTCLGAIFDLTLGTDAGGSGPSWVVGDTFLVCIHDVGYMYAEILTCF